jgi:glucose/arabinose dehydrogenase
MRTIPFLLALVLTACNDEGIDDPETGDVDTSDVDTNDVDTDNFDTDTDTDTDTVEGTDGGGDLPSALDLEQVGLGFTNPVVITTRPGDDRLWIAEQNGRIRPISADDTPGDALVDLRNTVSDGNEQGLLGLAFPPDHETSGLFYIHYTRGNGDSVLARYGVNSATPNVIDSDLTEVLWTVSQPFSNHNAGHIAFGPDGYLYVGYGDGGSGGDPLGAGQDDETVLGKMLRIDVSAANGYTAPSDNPFLDDADVPNVIWALGLRNPWKFSFDLSNDDLYIADVGQNMWEEISIQPSGSTGGDNYGWSVTEGNHCFSLDGCDMSGFVPAIHEYDHGSGCSITGGYVYRGTDIDGLDGHYFYSDFCQNQVLSFRKDGDGTVEHTNWTTTMQGAPNLQGVSTFGQDSDGELYVASHRNGRIYKIVTP